MEFKDVVLAGKRLCESYDGKSCNKCRLNDFYCSPLDCETEEEIEKWKQIVLKWAEEHKAVYPTIRELASYILGNIYCFPILNVEKYLDERIPEHIAKELNLVPINEGGLNKYVN